MVPGTPIPEDEQLYSDFDWFAVDQSGHIGHFTAAGFKLLPPSVAVSREDLHRLSNHFRKEAAIRGGHRVDVDLNKVIDSGNTAERYLRDFVFMADRGLYSFDIDSYLSPGVCYFRVASPTAPSQLIELPTWAQSILARTVTASRDWATSVAVPYDETLSW